MNHSISIHEKSLPHHFHSRDHYYTALFFSDVEDFRAGTITYNFPSGLTEDCQDIPIVDDDVVEDLQENFMLVIDFVDPDEVDPTAGDIPIATVVIRDDDGKSLGYDHTSGHVTVCIIEKV